MNQSKRTHQVNLVFAGVEVLYIIYFLFLLPSFFSSFLDTHNTFLTNLFKQALIGFLLLCLLSIFSITL